MAELLDGLSIVMIGRSSAAHLADCLGALAAVAADEIVFVDTGSTDATIAIARRHGCRVAELAWRDDFSRARNAAIELARHRWILSVDTDEILRTPDARAIVDQAIARAPAPAYLIVQDNVYDTGDVKPNPVARLFLHHPAIRFRNPVHECISESVLEHWPGHRFTSLPIHLEHRGFLGAHVAGKHARNLAILERWVAAEPQTLFGNFKLGSTLWDLGRTGDALPPLDRAYALLTEPAIRARAPYVKTFIVIYHRALVAARSQHSADAFERIADAWLAGL